MPIKIRLDITAIYTPEPGVEYQVGLADETDDGHWSFASFDEENFPGGVYDSPSAMIAAFRERQRGREGVGQ